MSTMNRRQTVFVCSAISNSCDLISEIVSASSLEEASKIFEDKYLIKCKSVLGPFIKKRSPVVEPVTMKFAGMQRQALYDGWLVNAFTLQDPADSAFLVFIRRADGQPKPVPKGKIVVPINNLRFI